MVKLAIIGGTGVYDPRVLTSLSEESVETEYGVINVTIGEYNGVSVAFLARHGSGHKVPPHKVNYRGNIMALKKLGVERIIATGAVGSLNLEMSPGEFILVDQFIDFTKSRIQTFFEDSTDGFVHIDMTEPYCLELRKVILNAGVSINMSIQPRGTYVCTEGPRFETPAEINMYSDMGGDLVGMTSIPEAVLAREAEICYATIAMVTNFAAGIAPAPLTQSEVMEAMQVNSANLIKLVTRTIEIMPEERMCNCHNALYELGSMGQGKHLS